MEIPSLKLVLPGTWFEIDLSDEKRELESIKYAVKKVVGTHDENATVRKQLKQKIHQASSLAKEKDASAIYIAHELKAGVPLAATITVFTPAKMHMSPAVGTSPEEVLQILRLGLTEQHTDIKDLECGNFSSLRTVTRARNESWDDVQQDHYANNAMIKAEADQVEIIRITADYWCHVPNTKRIIIVSCSTEMSQIENIMLGMFDAILKSSYFYNHEEEHHNFEDLLQPVE